MLPSNETMVCKLCNHTYLLEDRYLMCHSCNKYFCCFSCGSMENHIRFIPWINHINRVWKGSWILCPDCHYSSS